MAAKTQDRGSRQPHSDPPSWRRAIVLAIVLLGVGWRFAGIWQWPSSFHVMRQHHDAILARILWLRMRPQPLTAGEQLWLTHSAQPLLEAPILETLTALGYVVFGGEYPWLSYVLSSCFWLAGAWFVFDLVRRLTGQFAAAVSSLAVYLLAPLGIILSRSFQPEALMILALVLALWLVIRQRDSTSWWSTIGLGLACGLAMLIKPGFAFFPVLGTYLASRFPKFGWRGLVGPHCWVFVILFVAPSLIYAWFFLGGHSGEKLLPQLLVETAFYRSWWARLNEAVGWYLFVAALAGAWLMRRDYGSLIGFGLLAGYLAFSAAFTWHSATHSYYHALLVPIVAICMGPLGARLHTFLAQPARQSWLRAAGLVGVLLVLIALPLPAFSGIMRPEAIDEAIKFHKDFGKHVGPGTKVAFLGEDYGRLLAFYGWLAVYSWPVQADLTYDRVRGANAASESDRLRDLINNKTEYFVVSNMAELRAQPKLAALLKKYPMLVDERELAVYDLRPQAPTESSAQGAVP